MPELPEVETVRRSLLPYVLNKQIQSVDVHYKRILQDVSVPEFKYGLRDNRFIEIGRRGKYLLFYLESQHIMVVHLRMTGRLIFVSNSQIPLAKHTSVVFAFSEGSALRFEDQRKFATINFLTPDRLHEVRGLREMGPEPLSEEFTLEVFSHILRNRKAAIKGLLLDQRRIAGLGNIYADESLFMAGIHPERPANSLTKKEQERLYTAIRTVLQDAVDNQGTTVRDYRTGYGTEGSFQNKLQIYGKKGQHCPQCGEEVAYKKVVGRTSHFCPTCQKE